MLTFREFSSDLSETIRFDNSKYVSTHGKNPSSTTFGAWAFQVGNGPSSSKPIYAPSGTLKDAKKWVREKLGHQYDHDIIVVYVLG